MRTLRDPPHVQSPQQPHPLIPHRPALMSLPDSPPQIIRCQPSDPHHQDQAPHLGGQTLYYCCPHPLELPIIQKFSSFVCLFVFCSTLCLPATDWWQWNALQPSDCINGWTCIREWCFGLWQYSTQKGFLGLGTSISTWDLCITVPKQTSNLISCLSVSPLEWNIHHSLRLMYQWEQTLLYSVMIQ